VVGWLATWVAVAGVWPAKIATDSINYTASAYRFHHVAVVLTIAIFGPPSQICISLIPFKSWLLFLATFAIFSRV